MKRLLLILQRVFSYALQIPGDTKEFGFNAALWLWWVNVLPSQKGQRYIAFMTKWMNKCFEPVTEAFRNNTYDADMHIPENHIQPKKIPIWVCWLQGEESMPELVKLCYRQLKKNAPDYTEIHLLTIDNYDRYITLPKYVIRKFEEKKITMIHFTDIMRVSLLYAYGGMWIDSTVFTSKRLPDEFFKSRFYGQKMADKTRYPNEPSKAQWSGFLMSGQQGNKLFCYLRNTLWHYWNKQDTLIEYLILDYCLLSAREAMREFGEDIDNIKPNNEGLWELWNRINSPYNSDEYGRITSSTTFFKTSYKTELKKYTDKGEETFYKHMLDISNETGE